MKGLGPNKLEQGCAAYSDGFVWLWPVACRGFRTLLKGVGEALQLAAPKLALDEYKRWAKGGPGVRAVWSEYSALTKESGRWRGAHWVTGPIRIEVELLGARNAAGEVVWVDRAKVQAVERAVKRGAWFAVRGPREAVLVMYEGVIAGLVMPVRKRVDE